MRVRGSSSCITMPFARRLAAHAPPGPLLAAALLTAVLLAPAASAQDARSLGMGGVTVAGPGATSVNPAFAAVPGSGGSSLTLPMGALSALTRDYWDPYGPGFDALSTLDQASALGLYLLDPAVSPDRVTVGVDAAGLSVGFEGGSTMDLARPASYDGGLELPIGGSLGPVRLGVRPFATVHVRFDPGSDLKQVFAGGSTSASADLTADAEAGVALDVGTALPLPVPSSALGGGRLYAGVRASAVAGLEKASLSVHGTAQAEQDSNGNLTGNVLYGYNALTSVGGVLTGGGPGYGGQAALGFAASFPTAAGTLTTGVSVRHLGVMVWNLDQVRMQGDQSSSSNSDLGYARQVEVADHVHVAAQVALDIPPETLDAGGLGLVVAADGDLDLSGGLAAHAGAEARLGIFAFRAGLGYQDGLRLGVGAGVRAGPVGFDVALATHPSPLTDHRAFGVAASVAFGF